MGSIVGVDIGGTFTDFVAFDKKSRRLFAEKVLTTPSRPADAVIQGLSKLSVTKEVLPNQIEKIYHATTLATNAVIERKGAKTGLLTTHGFEDVLDIGKGLRYNQYDLKLQFPPPYVPRFLRRGVKERILASGETYEEMKEEEILSLTEELVDLGIISLSICFLHSYANPEHEIRTRSIIQRNFPDLFVSVSHEVTSQIREYERTSSTVIDAYVKPLVHGYLEDLSGKLEQIGFVGKLLIMTCTGGMVETSAAKKLPVQLLESGPVAGVSMSTEIARRLGLRGVFSFDMGGTTSKGCIVRDWKIEKSYEFEAARYDKYRRGSGIPISIPVVRLIETGSGGGSIARVDDLGLVRVGPESAGANPGPACYGLGGTRPTVTDCDLELGYLDENYFLGGSMKLYSELSKEAIKSTICKQMGLSQMEAAWAVYERVNEDVATAFRLYSAEIGIDYRRFSYIPFGGAGPVHAARITKKLGINKMVVPLRSGVLSAEGLIVSPLSIDLVRTRRQELSDLEYQNYFDCFQELILRGCDSLLAAGVKRESIRISRKLDMCYHGQGYEVPVELKGKSPSRYEFNRLPALFNNAYRAKYFISGISKTIDVTSYKATISAPSLKLPIEALEEMVRKGARRTRQAYEHESGRTRNFEVLNRYSLRKNDRVNGPALVQEIESTLLLPSDASATVDSFRNLVVEVH
ncbi:MAG TPA: hydantoinase/oxoprolinase family protein [Nitrososphaerales archaeon]|nr:hydantoinase/oxoprolinase family protein [Nitrososphaerales archaeon]